MDYSEKTVAQLKEILKERNLSIHGLKHDLIERLQSNDETKLVDNGQILEDNSLNNSENDEKKEEAIVHVDQVDSKDKVDSIAFHETKEENTSKEPISSESLKRMAIEHLNKQIYRARKFGEDESKISNLEKQIQRIEKFGLDMNTSLAKELGFSVDLNSSILKQNHNRNIHKRNRFNRSNKQFKRFRN